MRSKCSPYRLAGCLLLLAVAEAPAFEPPLVDTLASVSADGFDIVVRFEVFDPVLNEFVAGQRRYQGSSLSAWTVSSLINESGTVAWLTTRSGDFAVADAEVGFAVYDPVTARWSQAHRTYDASQRQFWSVNDLQLFEGRVAWRAQMIGDGPFRDAEAALAAYNPARQTWVQDAFTLDGSTLSFWTITNLVSAGRVVAWRNVPRGTASTFDAAIGYATFDDLLGRWILGQQAFDGTSLSFWLTQGPVVGDQLVAWSAQTAGTVSPFDAEVGYSAYDTSLMRWRKSGVHYNGEEEDPWTLSSLNISNHRVRWTARDKLNIRNELRGYNQANGTWASSPNSAYASFATSASAGTNSLAVWFGDRSLGATSWDWDFGDGSDSVEANPYHVFTQPGIYHVQLNVSGPAGSSSASMSVTNAPPQSSLQFDVGTMAKEPDRFLVALSGVPVGQQVIVWASSNMISWQSIFTNMPGTNRWEFADPLPQGVVSRFYRATLSP